MQSSDAYVGSRIPVDPGTRATRSRALSRLQLAKAVFVLAAGASFLFSVYLWFLVDKQQGLFVGLWVPSILSLGGLMLAGKGELR